MSSDIISTLHLEKNVGQGRVIVVKEINGCDASFITSCVISHQIKLKSSTLVITFHNSLTHYHNVGLKMNYNLKKNIDAHLVEWYNVGDDIVDKALKNTKMTLENIFCEIKQKVNMCLDRDSSINVIIDGVSHLFNLQYSLKEINIFLRQIISLIINIRDSFVIFQCNIASEEDVTNVMANMLSHMADTVVEISNLPTGLSTDISGHLIVKHPGKKFNFGNSSIIDFKPSCYHFKLFDRGVKLFAPGVV